MKKTNHTEPRILAILKEPELGRKVEDETIRHQLRTLADLHSA